MDSSAPAHQRLGARVDLVQTMKLVMAIRARNEEDVLEHNLRYHRALGVDHFILTDNASTDRTPEIVRRYAAAGLLTPIHEPPTDNFRLDGGKWVTRMARLSATELGADWVVHADADEFWWPATGSLKQALEGIPDVYGVVVAPWSEFVARPDGPGPFWERMTIRRADVDLMPKVAHRGDPDAVLDSGAHEVDIEREGDMPRQSRGRAVMRALLPEGRADEDRLVWAPAWPARVLHFPLRSLGQFRQKVELAVNAHHQRAYDDLRRAYEEGRVPELYAKLVYDDAAVEAGLREGHLVEDRRLRDLLDRVPDPLDPDASSFEPIPIAANEAERELAALRLDAMRTLTHTQRSLSRQVDDAFRLRRFKRLRRVLGGAERELSDLRRHPISTLARGWRSLIRRLGALDDTR